jgi:hypothetical protein
MVWDWLKKDFAKDVAAIKALGGGLTSTARSSRVVGRGVQVATVGALAFIGEVLCDRAEPAELEKPKEVPYWDQGGANDWHYRQWDFSD